MPLEVLTGRDVPSLLARAQRSLGADAVVLGVRRVREDGRPSFEMTVADAATAAQRARLQHASVRGAEAVLASDRVTAPPRSVRTGASTPWAPEPAAYRPGRAREGAAAPPARAFALPRWPGRPAAQPSRAPSRIIALVGPTGAGKTTTIPKLAHHRIAFAERTTGFLNLDTFRVGAVEQSRHWAELARVPVETVWERDGIARARHRLREREVILVDTPGRGPRAASDLGEVQARLLELAPDEVHLVVPAGLQAAVLRRVFTTYLPLGVTHVLPTKLDECPDEQAVFETARQFGLPMRWLADGQEVPGDLHLAPETASRHEVFA